MIRAYGNFVYGNIFYLDLTKAAFLGLHLLIGLMLILSSQDRYPPIAHPKHRAQ
jgi:hypothetical protein